jgi:phosphatase and actin regulator 4
VYDSDSDEEDDEDSVIYRDSESILASKVERRDSLARFLSNRPSRHELIDRNILPARTDAERQEARYLIGYKLNRQLSARPTKQELEDKHILINKTADDLVKEMEEKKLMLSRKLSFRPTVNELRARRILKFSVYVEEAEVEMYDRKTDKPWTRLTSKDKAAIRRELNDFKSAEMEVHHDSRHFTRFHKP